MRPKSLLCRAVLVALLATVLIAPSAFAETKGKASGSVKSVAEATKAAFADLEIEHVDSAVTFVFATVVGKAETGSRIIVSIGSDNGESELTVTSDGPEDVELEQKVVDAIKKYA